MHIVTEAAAIASVSIGDAIAAIEEGFAVLARGEASLFAPVFGHGVDPGSRFSIKSALDRSTATPGVKVGTYWAANPRLGLRAHGSTTLLLDDDTGRPRALVSATHLNALRTAAADAVAVKFLSRPEASTVAIIGAGAQAWWDLAAVRFVRPVKEVRVWSRDAAKAVAFTDRVRARGLQAMACERQAAVAGADIVITATASREPLVQADWVSPGTHISAMGADGPGKRELASDLLQRGRLVADWPEQALRLGEFQHVTRRGGAPQREIVALGDVIVGAAVGRAHAEEVTVFDSSGVAIQDLAVANLALARALALGLTQTVDLYDAPEHGAD